jgi:hypothetical protein
VAVRCPAVLERFEEAGDQLFTFLRFPASQRTKTQASLPGQDAVLLLPFGLRRSGQLTLRALVGYQDMKLAKQAASSVAG